MFSALDKYLYCLVMYMHLNTACANKLIDCAHEPFQLHLLESLTSA